MKRWKVWSLYVHEEPSRIIEAPAWFQAREQGAIAFRTSPSAVMAVPAPPEDEVRIEYRVGRQRARRKPKRAAKRGKRWKSKKSKS